MYWRVQLARSTFPLVAPVLPVEKSGALGGVHMWLKWLTGTMLTPPGITKAL